MANPGDSIICGGFSFYNNFDSANLAKVELVKLPETFEKGNFLFLCIMTYIFFFIICIIIFINIDNFIFNCFQMDVKPKINHAEV